MGPYRTVSYPACALDQNGGCFYCPPLTDPPLWNMRKSVLQYKIIPTLIFKILKKGLFIFFRDVRVQLLSWFQCFLLPKFMHFLLCSAQNWHFYFNFALFFSVCSNFQSFLSVASHIPVLSLLLWYVHFFFFFSKWGLTVLNTKFLYLFGLCRSQVYWNPLNVMLFVSRDLYAL